MDKIKNITDAMQWATDYIFEYQKSGAFDPFSALDGTADKRQKLFTESVIFLKEIEELTESYRKIRNKIAM